MALTTTQSATLAVGIPGAVLGYGLTAILLSNPVGWGVVLGTVVGAAVGGGGGYLLGKYVEKNHPPENYDDLPPPAKAASSAHAQPEKGKVLEVEVPKVPKTIPRELIR